MRMSEEYEREYASMAAEVARAGQLGRDVTGFWPFLGSAVGSPCELLVVGRATNSWGSAPETPGADAHERGRAFARVAREMSESDPHCVPCALDAWHGEHGQIGARSAFWRVTRAVSESLGLGGVHWAAPVAWSNIAKLAPASGWNPGQELWDAQRTGVFNLFWRELQELQPKRILVLAGWDWLENLASHVGAQLQVAEKPLHRVGSIGTAAVVVSPHPMGKPQAPIIEAALRHLTKAT